MGLLEFSDQGLILILADFLIEPELFQDHVRHRRLSHRLDSRGSAVTGRGMTAVRRMISSR